MTITARQHIPSFVDTTKPPPRATVDSQEALLAVPWIARWTEGYGERPFFQWSVSDHNLMAEYSEGRFWWVVAHLGGDVDQLTLPLWVPVR